MNPSNVLLILFGMSIVTIFVICFVCLVKCNKPEHFLYVIGAIMIWWIVSSFSILTVWQDGDCAFVMKGYLPVAECNGDQ